MTESPPPGFGAILHSMLAPPPPDGPPYTHDVTPRRCEACAMSEAPECRDGVLYRDGSEATDYYDVYAGQCGCACHRLQPSYTLTMVGKDGEPVEGAMVMAGDLGGWGFGTDGTKADRVATYEPLKTMTMNLEVKLSRQQARGWTRLFADMLGLSPQEARRMPPSRVANAAYHQRQRNRVKRGRR